MSDISVMKNPILSCAAGRLCLCPLYRMQGYVSSIGQHACRPMVATTQISAFGCQRPRYALHCCTNGQGISDPESVVLISFLSYWGHIFTIMVDIPFLQHSSTHYEQKLVQYRSV